MVRAGWDTVADGARVGSVSAGPGWDGTLGCMPAPERAQQVPDVGVTFRYQGASYRVTSWLAPAGPPAEAPWWDRDPVADLVADVLAASQTLAGPDRCRLVFVDRADAVYVAGVGVAGCIARVADIEVTGMVDWPEAQLAGARAQAQSLVGAPVA